MLEVRIVSTHTENWGSSATAVVYVCLTKCYLVGRSPTTMKNTYKTVNLCDEKKIGIYVPTLCAQTTPADKLQTNEKHCVGLCGVCSRMKRIPCLFTCVISRRRLLRPLGCTHKKLSHKTWTYQSQTVGWCHQVSPSTIAPYWVLLQRLLSARVNGW